MKKLRTLLLAALFLFTSPLAANAASSGSLWFTLSAKDATTDSLVIVLNRDSHAGTSGQARDVMVHFDCNGAFLGFTSWYHITWDNGSRTLGHVYENWNSGPYIVNCTDWSAVVVYGQDNTPVSDVISGTIPL